MFDGWSRHALCGRFGYSDLKEASVRGLCILYRTLAIQMEGWAGATDRVSRLQRWGVRNWTVLRQSAGAAEVVL